MQHSAKSPPFTQFFGVDAKYAKHLRVVGEMCVVADTDYKVGWTKIDPRGKIILFVGYSTQHAGAFYRLLNPKTGRVIHSRYVKWIGKMWAELYKIKMIDRASGHVDPNEDFQLEEEEDQDVVEEELEPEEEEPEVIQVGQSLAEEPTETPVGMANDEPAASRTRSQTAASEPIAARTRQALGSSPEMSAFADVKDDKTLNELRKLLRLISQQTTLYCFLQSMHSWLFHIQFSIVGLTKVLGLGRNKKIQIVLVWRQL